MRACARAAPASTRRSSARPPSVRLTTFTRLSRRESLPLHRPLTFEARENVCDVGGVETDRIRQHGLLGHAHVIERRQDTVLHRRYRLSSALFHEQGNMDLVQAPD